MYFIKNNIFWYVTFILIPINSAFLNSMSINLTNFSLEKQIPLSKDFDYIPLGSAEIIVRNTLLKNNLTPAALNKLFDCIIANAKDIAINGNISLSDLEGIIAMQLNFFNIQNK